ncbi:MAG: hypothetical protein AAGJ08_25550 [Cyanobacteria bacterium P01_H01_bin.35]
MPRQKIGSVKSGKGNKCDVEWNPSSKEVYVCVAWDLFDHYAYAGKASSAGEAMNVAEAFVYNK